MPEFRTRPLNEQKDEQSVGGITLNDVINQFYSNIQENPEAQLRLVQIAQEQYNIDPSLLAAVIPEVGETIKQAQQQEQQESGEANGKSAQSGNREAATEEIVVQKSQEVQPEDVIGFLKEASDIHPNGEAMTMQEWINWAENNKDMVQTAIDMRL